MQSIKLTRFTKCYNKYFTQFQPMVYYRAPPRYPLPPWVLLLAGMLLGTTLSSLLHHNWWQSEHHAVRVDLPQSSRPETTHPSKQCRQGGGSLLLAGTAGRLPLQASRTTSYHFRSINLPALAACCSRTNVLRIEIAD
jgi:hypothetical protein